MEIATIESIFFAQAGMGFTVYNKPCTRGSVHAVTTGFKGLSSSQTVRTKTFCKDKNYPEIIQQ